MAQRRNVNTGSFGSSANYGRLLATYGPATTGANAAATGTIAPPDQSWRQDPQGNWYHFDGSSWQASPPPPPTAPTGMPGASHPPVSDAPPFTLAGTFDKLGLLLLLAVVSGVVTAFLKPPMGAIWIALFAALGVGLWTSFRPRIARIGAPVYALLEGAVLGVISSWYASQGRLIVPTAVVATAAIVLGVWFLYRSGLVRVGSRFAQVTMVACLGFIAAAVTAWITGLSFNGLGGLVIFGILYLIVAVMSLFVDFDFAVKAQAAGVSQDAEWYSAFSIMVATMMVYLALLRILGGRR